MELSRSKIKYLLIIHRLSRDAGSARSVDIAIRLGVARPSVHRMLCTLLDAGLVHMEPRGAVSLTAKGREAAERYACRYDGIYAFFTKDLGLSFYSAEQATINALSALPQDCIEALCTYCAQKDSDIS